MKDTTQATYSELGTLYYRVFWPEGLTQTAAALNDLEWTACWSWPAGPSLLAALLPHTVPRARPLPAAQPAQQRTWFVCHGHDV